MFRFFKRNDKKDDLITTLHISTLLALMDIEKARNTSNPLERDAAMEKAERYLTAAHEIYIRDYPKIAKKSKS